MCVYVCVWDSECVLDEFEAHIIFSLFTNLFSVLPPFFSLQSHLPCSLLSTSLQIAVALPRLSPPSPSLSLTGCQEGPNNMTFNHDGNMNSPAARLFFHVLADLFSLPAPVFSLEMIISAPSD